MSVTFDRNLKEWAGPSKPCLFNPSASVAEILHYAMGTFEDRTAVICADTDTRLTYRELRLQSVRVALNLGKIGLTEGGTVCFLSVNGLKINPLVYGCIFRGLSFSLMDVFSSEESLVKKFGLLKPKLVICDRKRLPVAKEALKRAQLDPKILVLEENSAKQNGFQEELESADVLLQESVLEESFQVHLSHADPAKAIVFFATTSGTTGEAKIMPMTNELVVWQSLGLIFPRQVQFTFSPISWISTANSMFRQVVSGGTRVITARAYSSELQAEIVDKYKVTAIFSITLYTFFFEEYLGRNPHVKLESLKSYACGGNMLFTDVQERFMGRLPSLRVFSNVYGMSELLTIAWDSSERIKTGSVGFPCQNTRIKILNESGQKCGPNEDGEVWVKIRVPHLNYLGTESNGCDSEGWFDTGDYGHFDDDGRLFLEGRKKENIRCKDREIFASTVENAIFREFGLTEICVAGINVPGYTFEYPAAAIVSPPNSLSAGEIEKFVAEKLSPAHIEGGVYFVEELPKTTSGKVRRQEVKKMLTRFYLERNREKLLQNELVEDFSEWYDVA